MDGWNTTLLLGRPIFRGYVSFREGIHRVELEFGYPHDILIGTEGHCFLTLRVFEDHFEVSAWVKMECCLKKRSKKGVTMRSKRRFGAIRMMMHFNAFYGFVELK